MATSGRKIVKALFGEARAKLARAELPEDPAPNIPRRFDGGDEIGAGQWPGAPVDKLPPGCPVVPLGIDGTVAYFIDSKGQVVAVDRGEWNKKTLMQLFALQPNYLTWAWPRLSAKTFAINGLEVDEACACLMKAAAARGLVAIADRVRGRGGWADKAGRFIWHSGDALWQVERGRLVASDPGEHDRVFYPTAANIVTPWPEPVPADESPAQRLLEDLKTWTWDRPRLDPILLLGWIGCAFLGGALPWRPTVFFTGDKGVGKSKLQSVIKAVLGEALHSAADTTAAGIYQRVKQDSLPVAVDELEAEADNRRVMAVVKLARLAASGAMMFRGGAEHKGVEFRACNAFAFSSINPPPLEPQDRSRIAILNLGRLDQKKIRGREIVIDADTCGRMILRGLMDAWPRFDDVLRDTERELYEAGLDTRHQNTYGTLVAVARLMLGDEGIEAAGLSVADNLGQVLAGATALERAEQSENWRACLEHLFSAQIEAWKGGEKPTIGSVLEDLEHDVSPEAGLGTPESEARRKLAAAGLGLKYRGEIDGCEGFGLAVPPKGQALAKIFAGSKWSGGVWMSALKQAPPDVVLRGAELGSKAVVKINRSPERCVIVDLAAYDRLTAPEEEA